MIAVTSIKKESVFLEVFPRFSYGLVLQFSKHTDRTSTVNND
jgi:hypothetical protein